MNMTINEFLANPMASEDDCFGFFDWFCRDKSLKNKMLALKGKVAFLVKSGLIDGDKHYVIFKNNCPGYGELYDDLRVMDNETDDMVCGLAPKLGYEMPSQKGKCEFWKFDKDGELIEMLFDNYKAFKAAVKKGEVVL